MPLLTYLCELLTLFISMLKKFYLVCILSCCICSNLCAQSEWMEWWEHMDTDEGVSFMQEQYEELSELAEHPFNINTITKEQLEQLPFLSDKMIENILYYLYKYGPMLTKNELLGVEGMDVQTRRFLEDFIYIGPAEDDRKDMGFRKIWKYGKQELMARVDFPVNKKAGYAEYSEKTLSENPDKKYIGDPFYHNVRYKFQYKDRIFFGFAAEKDAGEPFFALYNRKGYDFYSASLFLNNFGKIKALVLGNYRASFGYGLVMNMGFNMGKSSSLGSMNRVGRGLMKYASTNESDYLQGAGITVELARRWTGSVFYSFRMQDARVEDMFIRTMKTDGYHRLKKDMEKKNTVNNHLIGCNLSYNGKYMEYGLTTVYNVFNKLLNPAPRLYNRYYPRGQCFFNIGANYKFFLQKLILSGELAFDKSGALAMLHTLSYSPSVNTTFIFMNRYYDKRYQSLYANGFGENTKTQNELGFYIGLETNALSKCKLVSYVDFFYFPWYRYQVDRRKTIGLEGVFQLSYSHSNSLNMLIKYSCKNKAKNFIWKEEEKYILPNIRQRFHGQVSYQCTDWMHMKGVAEYVRSSYWKQRPSNGYAGSATFKLGTEKFPLRGSVSASCFFTDDYASRIYLYEPGLLYAFSMMSFYGKGTRLALNMNWRWKKLLTIQAKWGWTHYGDRSSIGSGMEKIQGNNKFDLQLQLRIKW